MIVHLDIMMLVMTLKSLLPFVDIINAIFQHYLGALVRSVSRSVNVLSWMLIHLSSSFSTMGNVYSSWSSSSAYTWFAVVGHHGIVGWV